MGETVAGPEGEGVVGGFSEEGLEGEAGDVAVAHCEVGFGAVAAGGAGGAAVEILGGGDAAGAFAIGDDLVPAYEGVADGEQVGGGFDVGFADGVAEGFRAAAHAAEAKDVIEGAANQAHGVVGVFSVVELLGEGGRAIGGGAIEDADSGFAGEDRGRREEGPDPSGGLPVVFVVAPVVVELQGIDAAFLHEAGQGDAKLHKVVFADSVLAAGFGLGNGRAQNAGQHPNDAHADKKFNECEPGGIWAVRAFQLHWPTIRHKPSGDGAAMVTLLRQSRPVEVRIYFGESAWCNRGTIL